LTEEIDIETIVIDPQAMNIVNRVAPGCRQSGVFHCQGGLMVEGCIEGDIEIVGGPLVLMPGGVIAGRISADGQAYLFGTIRARCANEPSVLEVAGEAFLTQTLRARANITAGSIRSYQGAEVDGRIDTGPRKASGKRLDP